MITRYDILYEKDNVVLIVKLDFFYEFAEFNYKSYTKNLRKEIENIAKRNGARIVKIMIGGVLLSTLLLNTNENIINNEPTFITNKTIKESLNNIELDKEDIIIIDVSKPSNDIEDKNPTHSTTITKPTLNIKPETNLNHTNIVKPSINVKPTIKEETKKEISIKEETKDNTTQNKEELDTNIYVTIYRNNGSIVKLELEEYLIGVVGSEMPASFNIEALKAQAIVARTYTMKSISTNKKLTDTTSTQVYKDNYELKSIWGNLFDKYYNKIKTAVMSTKGIVLMYDNNYIDAVYHSTSNGKTEDAIHVWGNDIPYLKSVSSTTDLNASSYERKKTFTKEELSIILNTNIDDNTNFILERNTSGRVSNVKVNDIEIKGTTFRNLLNLRSTDFTIEISDNIIITTHGYGHGVGMSQYGANGLANEGYTYKQILSHYYKGITFKNL